MKKISIAGFLRVSLAVFCGLALSIIASGINSKAYAGMIDLTTADSWGTANGAFFIQYDPRSTGSGVLDPFVRLQTNNNQEQGYNTDGRPHPVIWPDVNTSITHTHSLQLKDLVVVGDYYEFVLDVNENNNELISLDMIKIYLANSGDTGIQTTANISDLGTLVYDLDGGSNADNWIKLDARLSTGSGQGDMVAFIPKFAGDPEQYVYFYSRFGDHNYVDAGFEEWGLVEGGTGVNPPVPEPASMSLLGLGLLGLGALRRKTTSSLRTPKGRSNHDNT